MSDKVKIRALVLLWYSSEERYVQPGEELLLSAESAEALVANGHAELISPSKKPLGPVQPTEKE